MQRIGFIIPEGFQMLALAPQTVFEYANMCAGKAIYDVRVLSEKGRLLRSTLGIALQTERFSGLRFDTLIFGGTNEASPRLTPGLLNFARRALKTSRRVASMCTGAFVLAEAGLLDGRRATTHWAFSRELQRRFPKAKVEEDRILSSTALCGLRQAPQLLLIWPWQWSRRIWVLMSHGLQPVCWSCTSAAREGS